MLMAIILNSGNNINELDVTCRRQSHLYFIFFALKIFTYMTKIKVKSLHIYHMTPGKLGSSICSGKWINDLRGLNRCPWSRYCQIFLRSVCWSVFGWDHISPKIDSRSILRPLQIIQKGSESFTSCVSKSKLAFTSQICKQKYNTWSCTTVINVHDHFTILNIHQEIIIGMCYVILEKTPHADCGAVLQNCKNLPMY